MKGCTRYMVLGQERQLASAQPITRDFGSVHMGPGEDNRRLSALLVVGDGLAPLVW